MEQPTRPYPDDLDVIINSFIGYVYINIQTVDPSAKYYRNIWRFDPLLIFYGVIVCSYCCQMAKTMKKMWNHLRLLRQWEFLLHSTDLCALSQNSPFFSCEFFVFLSSVLGNNPNILVCKYVHYSVLTLGRRTLPNGIIKMS